MERAATKFYLGATDEQLTLKLTWLTATPVWVDQWPLTAEKL